jgi:hypothetical protein
MTRHTHEKSFQASIIQLAGLLGWRVYFTYDSRRSPSGFPDLVLLKADQALFRELKVAGGRLSVEQREWGEALTAAGLDWQLWTPADWDAIGAQLRGQQQLGGAA